MEKKYTPIRKNKKENRDLRHKQTISALEHIFEKADEIYIDVSMLSNSSLPAFVQNGTQALIHTGKKLTIAKPALEKLEALANIPPEYVGTSQYMRDKNAVKRISASVGEFALSFFAEAGLLSYLDYEYADTRYDAETSTLFHIIKQKCVKYNKRLVVLTSNTALINLLKRENIDKNCLSVFQDFSMDYGYLYKEPYRPQIPTLVSFDTSKVAMYSDCIYIDTCSLMHSGAPKFAYRILDELEKINSSGMCSKKQLRILNNVAEELNQHMNGPRTLISRRLSAYRGILVLRELLAHVNSIPVKDACISYVDASIPYYGGSADRHSTHADKIFTNIVANESDSSNLVFITQDAGLTADINNYANTSSTNRKPVIVCMLSSEGTLVQHANCISGAVIKKLNVTMPEPSKAEQKPRNIDAPEKKQTPQPKAPETAEKIFSRSLLDTYIMKTGELIIPENSGFTTVTALSGEPIIRVLIPEGVKTINNLTFKSCKSLKQVVLPHSLVEIGSSAFVDCTALESITIPPLVKVLSASTFKGCTKLGKVFLNEGLTNIHANAFAGCTLLTDLYIPKSVVGISPQAFTGCRVTIHCAADSAAYRFAKDNGFTAVVE